MRNFVLEELIPRVDIIFESFRPGVMEMLNLGPSHIHAINPNVIYVRISGFGRTAPNSLTTQAGRDLNYLASSGILSKFRRAAKQGEPSVPTNILTYYASGSMFALAQVISAVHQKKPYTVIDCNLTMQLAYTSQPELLDAHLNHRGEPSSRHNNHTLPQHCVYKCADGTNFIFKKEGILYKKYDGAYLANDDVDEIFYSQQTI